MVRRKAGRWILDSPWVWAVAAAQFALLVATSTRYGYHRDEFYFIVSGWHPAFGYPDQPPLVPLLCAAMHSLGGGSLAALRMPSALASVATTLLAALIAREVGGEGRAQLIAAACTAVSAFALAVGHFVTTTTFDLLSTTLLGWLAIRAVRRRSALPLLLAGIAVGVGFEAKPQVGLVAAVMAVVFAVVGPRWPLTQRWWTAAAACAACGLAAPYLVWQGLHGWPQLTVAHNIAGSAENGRIGFIPFQLVMVSPLLVPVWVRGLRAPFRRPGWEDLRFVPLTYGAIAIVYLLTDGKAYYLASLYPIVLGMGAIPTAERTLRSRRSARLLAVAIALSGCISAVIALPLLPVRDLQGSVVMALDPDQGETVGWPEFLGTVAQAWRHLPRAERAHTAIFTGNYGEAGAIGVLGRAEGLPRAYSGHNGFSEWGMPPRDATHALVVGFTGPRDAAPSFRRCRTVAVVHNGAGLDNQEQGMPVMLCTVTAPWPVIWDRLTHFD
jgi:4-amino-4-deoxy-L-arabinose transferase-like glycosyltransferase